MVDVKWLVCRLTARWIRIRIQPWRNPWRLTGLRTPTKKQTNPVQMVNWMNWGPGAVSKQRSELSRRGRGEGTLLDYWKSFTANSMYFSVPVGSSSHGGDVTVHVLDINWPSLPTLLFCSCVCFCLYSPFNCILFHKFSRQLSTFSLFFRSYVCLTGPFNYISLYDSLPQPWYNPLWLTGLKAPTN